MTVTASTKDAEKLAFTIVTEFDATPERVWQLWADPRQLERWWGPPTYPATFVRHEFEVDGESRYYMTGPGGDRSHAWILYTALDEPRRIDLDDGFSGSDGEPISLDDHASIAVTIEPLSTNPDTGTRPRTRMTTVVQFRDLAQMEQLVGMGMQEGMALAMGQIDVILAEG